MVGGKVIETKESGNKMWINVQEYLETKSKLLNNFCAIFVELSPKSRSVSEGDIVWWQGTRAYWTAKDSRGNTIGKPNTILNRIGFSGITRPE